MLVLLVCSVFVWKSKVQASVVFAHEHAATHTHTHKRMHACTHARTHARMHTRTHTHACMHARAHTHTHTHTVWCMAVHHRHKEVDIRSINYQYGYSHDHELSNLRGLRRHQQANNPHYTWYVWTCVHTNQSVWPHLCVFNCVCLHGEWG